MSKTGIYVTIIIIIILALLIIWWVWVNFYSPPPVSTTATNTVVTTPSTIQLGQNTTFGSFLTDSKGMTLYYFANDIANTSNCIGQCQTIWPAFYAPQISVPDGLNPADFASIVTSSGANQTTYKGWPLYYYSGDKQPGDTNGDGVQKIWFVARNPFYNVLIMNNSNNNSYLASIDGLAIYYNNKDIKGTTSADPQSKCDSTCLGNNWTIFDQSQFLVPSILNKGDFQEFTRTDGQTQLSYKGWPLYLYSGDSSSGNTKGNGLNKTWYLVKP